MEAAAFCPNVAPTYYLHGVSKDRILAFTFSLCSSVNVTHKYIQQEKGFCISNFICLGTEDGNIMLKSLLIKGWVHRRPFVEVCSDMVAHS